MLAVSGSPNVKLDCFWTLPVSNLSTRGCLFESSCEAMRVYYG